MKYTLFALPLALLFLSAAPLAQAQVCFSDANCSAGQTCSGGTCTSSGSVGTSGSFGCASSADCASGQSCVSGVCSSSATSNVTCPAGTVNEFGTCLSTGTTGTSVTGTPTPSTSGLTSYAATIQSLINTVVVPILIAIAFIVFLWGVFNYFILGADSEDKRKEGRVFVLYGVIGFVIIFSLWGIVNLVSSTVGLGGQNHPTTPTL